MFPKLGVPMCPSWDLNQVRWFGKTAFYPPSQAGWQFETNMNTTTSAKAVCKFNFKSQNYSLQHTVISLKDLSTGAELRVAFFNLLLNRYWLWWFLCKLEFVVLWRVKAKITPTIHSIVLTVKGFSAESKISGNNSLAYCSLSLVGVSFFKPVKLIQWIWKYKGK